MNKERISNLVSYVALLISAAIIGWSFSFFIFQRIHVVGVSMEPTYIEGDTANFSRLYTWTHSIHYQDVVVINGAQTNGAFYIKRVIALPGDTIEISEDGMVLLNGNLLQEDYIKEIINKENLGNYRKITLQEDEYFVMGDNRNHSYDSRMFGPVKKETIQGIVQSRP